MSNEPTITLFDAGTVIGAISPFVWRVRMGLNFKKVNYKTEWLTFVTIKPTFEKLGFPPTPHPVEKEIYTVPGLMDRSTTPPTLVTDSVNVEKYVDEKFPDPPLYAVRPSGCSDADWEAKLTVLTQVDQFLRGEKDPRWHAYIGFVVPNIADNVKPEDVSYFKETRSKWFQQAFEDIRYKDDVAEAKLADFKAAFETLEGIIGQGPGKQFHHGDTNQKPWVLGDTVSRGDFTLLGTFMLISKVNPELWEKMKTWNSGRWARMMELSAEWRVENL